MADRGGDVLGVVAAVCGRHGAVIYIPIDAAVGKRTRVSGRASAKRASTGGGGTDLRPALDAARADITVVVTDCYTPWPDVAPVNAGAVIVVCREGDPDPPAWAITIRRARK